MQKYIVFSVGGFILGILITYFIYQPVINQKALPNLNQQMTMQKKDHSMHQGGGMNMENTMKSMNEVLKGKTGEVFDQAFLSEMIVHHQGAIDMANMALKNAGHEEIKTMAQDIISAQTTEIEQMKKWQSEWGFEK